MADYFVDSNASGTASGADWTNAWPDLYTALVTNSIAAGSVVYVAHNHYKDYAADTTLTNNGTLDSPICIVCVNTTTGAVTTGAEEEAAGVNNNFHCFQGGLLYDGVALASGSGSTVPNTLCQASNGSFEFTITSSVGLTVEPYSGVLKWKNFWFKAIRDTQYMGINSGAWIDWDGGGVDPTGTGVNRIFDASLASRGGGLKLRNLDLSNVTDNLIALNVSETASSLRFLLTGCKLPVGVPIVDTESFAASHEIIVRSCDVGDGYNFFTELYREGKITQDTGNYLNATYDGTNGYSAKITSNAKALDRTRPLRFMLSEFWAGANPTVIVETLTDGVTLQDDECWIEIEYPDATDQALRKINDDAKQTVGWGSGTAPGTPTNLTTSTAAWTETLTTETKQKMTETVTGGATGPHRVFVCLAKPSTTVYVDPKVMVG